MRTSGVPACGAAVESADMRRNLVSYTLSSGSSVTGFFREGGALVCDGVPLAPLADAHRTPLYVYSAAEIAARYRAIDDAFAGYPHRIHYALKANSTLAIARLLRGLGSGADANSVGEIDVALRAGFLPSDIVFTGVGKTADELDHAVPLGVKAINVESAGELARLQAIASGDDRRVRIALRINPDIDAKSHPHISTGLQHQQVRHSLRRRRRGGQTRRRPRRHRRRRAPRAYRLADHRSRAARRGGARARRRWPARWSPTDCRSSTSTSAAASACRTTGRPCRRPLEYARALLPIVREAGLPIVLEPGRPIVGAGRRAARARHRREAQGRRQRFRRDRRGHDGADASGAVRRLPPDRAGGAHGRPHGDCRRRRPGLRERATRRTRPPAAAPRAGRPVRHPDAGAYGRVHGVELQPPAAAAEVLVEHGTARLVRRRQTVDDMLALEI